MDINREGLTICGGYVNIIKEPTHTTSYRYVVNIRAGIASPLFFAKFMIDPYTSL